MSLRMLAGPVRAIRYLFHVMRVSHIELGRAGKLAGRREPCFHRRLDNRDSSAFTTSLFSRDARSSTGTGRSAAQVVARVGQTQAPACVALALDLWRVPRAVTDSTGAMADRVTSKPEMMA